MREVITKFQIGKCARYVLRRGKETWIARTPWAEEDYVHFEVAGRDNTNFRRETMTRTEFSSIPICDGSQSPPSIVLPNMR